MNEKEEIVLGFSGTKEGMDEWQKVRTARILETLNHQFIVTEAHHGMCEGSDEEFEYLVRKWVPNAKIIGHPGVDGIGRSPTRSKSSKPDHVESEMRYLKRDRRIAYVCNIFIATPLQPFEIVRSGTWSTVRYAREYNKQIFLVMRGGDVKEENKWITQ